MDEEINALLFFTLKLIYKVVLEIWDLKHKRAGQIPFVAITSPQRYRPLKCYIYRQ